MNKLIKATLTFEKTRKIKFVQSKKNQRMFEYTKHLTYQSRKMRLSQLTLRYG